MWKMAIQGCSVSRLPQVPKSPIFLTHATRTWNMEIICHQPRLPWNKGSHFPWLNHHLGGPKLVWGCYNLTKWPNNSSVWVFIFTSDSCFQSKIPLFLLASKKKDRSTCIFFRQLLPEFPFVFVAFGNRAADQSTSASSTCWECSEAWWWYNSPGRLLACWTRIHRG